MERQRFSDATIASVRKLVPIDDIMFQKMCESKATCQEIISTILGQPITVIEVVPQFSIKNLQGRSVTLDCLCQLDSGVYVNVEVQKPNNDDHEARVRYNASAITANMTPKGAKFRDVAQVIVIYITKFDIFGGGLPIYHIDRVVRETGQVRTDGFTEIYVNAAVKNYDNELNANVSELMDLFTDHDKLNLDRFPEFSRRKHEFIGTQKGEMEMYETYYDYVREREQEAVLTALFKGVQDGGIRVTYAAKEANLSLNEFKDQMRLRGYTIPQRGKRTTTTAK